MTTATFVPPMPRVARDPSAFLKALPGPALTATVATLYLALAQLVILLNDPVQLGAGFWPAAGLSLSLLVLLDTRVWPWILAGVALAEFGGDLAHGYAVSAIGFWTVGNVVEPLVGAVLIRRLSPDPRTIARMPALVVFLLCGVLAGPLLGATIGSLGTIVVYGSSPDLVWPKYVVGDALGVLVVAPVLLTWTHRSVSRARLEAILLAAGATVVTLLVFRNWDVVWDVTLPYLILPFLVWAGLRFGVRGVALVGFVVANIANWATAMGYGPFAITGGTEHAVTLLQVFLGITLATGLLLAALANELTDSRERARRQSELSAAEGRNRAFHDAFVGVLSHEIRTPITTIYGMSQLLRTRHALDPEGAGQYVEDIASEAERLRRLTEDLLVLSRAEGGGLQVARDPIAMGHVVKSAVDGERARSASHDITFDEASPLPLVLGEDVYVEQIVRNFLGNAAKYSPPGTTIDVLVTAEGGGVTVRVIDGGPGLPGGPADRLFDLFYRDPGAIGTSAGAGVGLFVCRALAEAMGGRVWARSAPDGRGAEFGLWLPAAAHEDLIDD